MDSKEQLYVVKGRNLSSYNAPISEYITTNEDFKRFCGNVIDLENTNKSDTLFSRCVESIEKADLLNKVLVEDRAIQGIQKVIETKKGKVKIGFTRIRKNLIYVLVEDDNRYLRGFSVLFADLCLVHAMNFIPLDKSTGDGNIQILKYNKRKATKGIKFIHNKVESILYMVDLEFETYEEMLQDIDNPKDINYALFIEPILRIEKDLIK